VIADITDPDAIQTILAHLTQPAPPHHLILSAGKGPS
jgi:hypothetical protein